MSSDLTEAVRGLHVANPDLGFKPLLAKLREQQPDLEVGSKEVRKALKALKAESEAALVPPTADEGVAPCSHAALSLACAGCFRLPSDMDNGREKHPVCHECVKEKLPTTYWCGLNCPANPGAMKLHSVFHKEWRKEQKMHADGGVLQQLNSAAAEELAQRAAQTGDEYEELLAEGLEYASKDDLRRAGKAFRKAIPLRPNDPVAYLALGGVFSNSGHPVESSQLFLEATERFPEGSEGWAHATCSAIGQLRLKECAEVVKPEWWNDEGLKALTARIVRLDPNDESANHMRAHVLSGGDASQSWEVGTRSAVELKEAAAYYERAAALCNAPALKADRSRNADRCRMQAEELEALQRANPSRIVKGCMFRG